MPDKMARRQQILASKGLIDVCSSEALIAKT